jgi:putative transcriptional regulator
MIRCNLKKLMAEKEIASGERVTYQSIHQVTGLATTTLHKLATNKTQRFDASTLDALCQYFGVQIGDILVHVPDGKGGTSGEA